MENSMNPRNAGGPTYACVSPTLTDEVLPGSEHTEERLQYAFDPERIPKPLRKLPCWLCWQGKPKAGRSGKFDKVPINPKSGNPVSHTAACMAFDEAMLAYMIQESSGPEITGIGLSIPPGLTVIDLDNIFDDEGRIKPHHQAILNTFSDCYTELSPSERGAHIFVVGTAPGYFSNHAEGVEVYSPTEDGGGAHFITVTGMVFQDRGRLTRKPHEDELAELVRRYGPRSIISSGFSRELPPMPTLEGKPRTLKALEGDGTITPAWRALIEGMEAGPGNDRHLLDRYRHPEWSEGSTLPPVQRYRALFAAAKMFAKQRVPLWEAFAILTNRDYTLVQGIDAGRDGDAWCWEYVFAKHLDAYASQAPAATRFDDLGPADWSNPSPVQQPGAGEQPQPSLTLARALEAATMTFDELVTDESVIEPPAIIDPFFRLATITMVYAAPGIGKSWFVLDLIRAIYEAETEIATTFGPWRVLKPQEYERMPRCAYLDGELPEWLLQKRIAKAWPNGRPHDALIMSQARLSRLINDAPMLNFADPTTQRAIETWLESHGITVPIIDNQMSWVHVEDSNSADDIKAFASWIVRLRSKGMAPVIVHHANKAGAQYGSIMNSLQIESTIKLGKIEGEKNKFTFDFEKDRIGSPSPDTGVMEIQDTPQGTRLVYVGQKPDRKAVKANKRCAATLAVGIPVLRILRANPEIGLSPLSARLRELGHTEQSSVGTLKDIVLPDLVHRGLLVVAKAGNGKRATRTVTPAGIAASEDDLVAEDWE